MRSTYQSAFLVPLLCLLAVASGNPVRAWSEHAPMTYHALTRHKALAGKQVPFEPLNVFLYKERKELAALFAREEARLRKELPDYMPHPSSTIFPANASRSGIKQAFRRAARLGPIGRLAPAIYLPPGVRFSGPTARASELTQLKKTDFIEHSRYVRLRPGQAVPAIYVLAGASDEPDLGMDLGLFQDNRTKEGKLYGFGQQPFGNPNLEYSSQAPFHMGFFHEAGIVTTLAPFLKKTHVEYRIRLFHALARMAFRTGHDYWGYRFSGWALHYIQDLTQPYHSVVLPGVSTLSMLWKNVLAILGFETAKNHAIQLVSNRHSAIEGYQYERVLELARKPNPADPLVQALQSAKAVPFTPAGIRDRITKRSAAGAGRLDATLEATIPARYVSDPSYELTKTGEHRRLKAIVSAHKPGAIQRLDGTLAVLLQEFGAHTRGFLIGLQAE